MTTLNKTLSFLLYQITMAVELSTSINIKEPRWDQSTFEGRAKHFFTVTDPRNILLSNEQLESAHKIITDYRYRPSAGLSGRFPMCEYKVRVRP